MRFVLAFVLSVLAAPALAEPPRVAADILPVHSLVTRVMEGAGEPALILPPGASPHGYAMRPSEAAALEGAEVVVWVGPALTPWLERPLQTLAGDAVTVTLLERPETLVREVAEEEDGHGHGEHGHDHGPVDPHAWLDPENARAWLAVIAEVLAEADPANATLYRANAAEGAGEIDALIRDMGEALAPLSGQPYAVYHDALGYVEARFGLDRGVALLSAEADLPAPRRIAWLRDTVAADGVARVFSEPGVDTGLIDTVFEGREVAICEIDPVGSKIAPGPKQYWQAMLSLAETMGGCGA